jgi:hypothetical protein
MINEVALEYANKVMMAYHNHTIKLINSLTDEVWIATHGEWDNASFYTFRNLFFNLITGEKDFEAFYDRFDSPGMPKGQPIAWGPRFWPDMINDVFWRNEDLKVKVKEIQKLYQKCVVAEKNFKKRKK